MALLLGRPEASWAREARREDPLQVNAAMRVWSQVHLDSADADGAVLAYEMALRLDPSDLAIRRNLAVARGKR